MTTTCHHTTVTTIATRCFTGAVARAGDENRAAHGGVCDEEECAACGARRRTLVNGRHLEEGPWGPSRAARQHVARLARVEAARLVAAVAPVTVYRVDQDVHLTLSVDREGYILAEGSPHREADVLAAAMSQPEWLDSARRARRAVLAARAATDEV